MKTDYLNREIPASPMSEQDAHALARDGKITIHRHATGGTNIGFSISEITNPEMQRIYRAIRNAPVLDIGIVSEGPEFDALLDRADAILENYANEQNIPKLRISRGRGVSRKVICDMGTITIEDYSYVSVPL